MNTLPRIDVIIPAYNAHDTLQRTLGSIISQDIVKELDVLIVSDNVTVTIINRSATVINRASHIQIERGASTTVVCKI